MNTSRRVPGVSRNSGWQAVDAEIAFARLRQQQSSTTPCSTGSEPSRTSLVGFGVPPFAEQPDE
jgi:hypothetical protein